MTFHLRKIQLVIHFTLSIHISAISTNNVDTKALQCFGFIKWEQAILDVRRYTPKYKPQFWDLREISSWVIKNRTCLLSVQYSYFPKIDQRSVFTFGTTPLPKKRISFKKIPIDIERSEYICSSCSTSTRGEHLTNMDHFCDMQQLHYSALT